MPTATVSGALLGLAFDFYRDKLRKRSSGVMGSVICMAVGACAANIVVDWDNKARSRKLVKISKTHR